MVQKIPPQIVLLSIIAKNSEGLTLRELASQVVTLCKNGVKFVQHYSCGKGEGIVKEVLLDVNTLKVLGLVREVDGRYIVTEKGYAILGKLGDKTGAISR